MSQVSGVATVLVTQNSRTINLGIATDLINCFVETRDYDFDDPQTLKFLEEVVAEVYGPHTMELTVRHRETLNQALLNDGPFQIPSDGVDPVFCWSPGDNYYRLKFADATATGRWKLVKFSVHGKVAGKRY